MIENIGKIKSCLKQSTEFVPNFDINLDQLKELNIPSEIISSASTSSQDSIARFSSEVQKGWELERAVSPEAPSSPQSVASDETVRAAK